MTTSLTRAIREQLAGLETPTAISKRTGCTETRVFKVIRRKVRNWQESARTRTSLDVCPEHCTGPRPHKIATGVMVCGECFELEHSDRPRQAKERA